MAIVADLGRVRQRPRALSTLEDRLSVYRDDAATCVRCGDEALLHRHADGRRAYPLFHAGATCPRGVLIVAEAPNLTDTYDSDKGRLTVDAETDPTGRFLRDLLASVGLQPDDVLFTNSVLCLPARRNGRHLVRARQLELCRAWLTRALADVAPAVVVTLGAKALAAVGRVERHGLQLKSGVGQLQPWRGTMLLPLYHHGALGRISRPAALQRQDIRAIQPALREVGVA